MQLELVNGKSGSHHTVIQVIGIGGGGSNAVQRMIEHGLEGMQFIMANTDLQALESFQSPKSHMLPLGEKITGGLGAGGDPAIGREAAEEDVEKIRELLGDSHMVFVTAGMGGGTGTGAAPVIARAAKEMGKLCVAVVTTPFHFEGQYKFQLALQGVEELRKEVDTLIVIPNQLLLQVLDPGTSVREAFYSADEVLRMGVKGIADLITQPGDINVDFNDVCTVMRDGGEALMGIGVGSGEDRALRATIDALQNPLLSGDQMKGAKGLLVQITADESFSLEEYSCIMNEINAYVDTVSAKVISGIAIDSQKKDEIKVTVIATGFHHLDESLNELGASDADIPNQVELRGGRGGSPVAGYGNMPQNRVYSRSGSGMQSPLQGSLSTPMQKSRYSGAVGSSQRGNAALESGQAAQMRQALQQPGQHSGPGTALQHAAPQAGVALAEAPDRVVYRLNDEDNRLAEEQLEQVSNKELQMLFTEGSRQRRPEAAAAAEPQQPARGQTFGQKRVEPQLPPAQAEDLYVPTLLRRKQRKR